MKHSHTIGKLFVIALLWLGLVLSKPALADEESPSLLGTYLKDMDIEISGSATMDYYSRYVWRGQYLDRDQVLQPGVSFSAKGFTAGWWGSFDMENLDALTSDENDFYLSYSYTFEKVTGTVGHTWYDFPEYDTTSKEFFLSVGVDMLLSPTFSYFHDYEDGKDLNTEGNGNYFSLGVSHSFAICEKTGTSLDLAMTFGYVDGQWLSGQGTHLTPTVGLTVPLTSSFSITPTVGYNVPMGDLEDENILNQEDKVFGGLKMAYSF